jgi:acylglycerol lipase
MESYNHDISNFSGKGGVKIFFQKWIAPKAKAVLVLVHGVGEHSGRYNNLLDALADKGVSVFALDHRGHGKSEGKRGHVDSFMDYIYDLKLFVEYVKDENKGLPLVLYGHSMGGVIAAKYGLTYQNDPSMVVLSSPGFAPAFKVPGWKKSIASFLSSKAGSFSMPTGLSSSDISRDKEVVKEYDNDPLVHGKVSAKWFTEFMKAGEECMANASSLKKPLLVFYGTGDKIVDYKATEEFYNNAGSSQKDALPYDGFYHEVINEPEADRNRALKDVVSWILKQVNDFKKPAASKKAVKKTSVKKASSKKTVKAATKKASSKKPAVKKTAKAAPKAESKASPKVKTSAKKSAAKKPASPKKDTKK